MSIANLIELFDKETLSNECQRWALTNGKFNVDSIRFDSIRIEREFRLGFVQRRFLKKTRPLIIPYPMTIFPSPFPRHEYQRAREIQTTINALIYRLGSKIDLIDEIFKT